MTWPAVVFWILMIVGVFSRGSFLLYLFFAAAPFGSLTMVPAESIGVNLLPQSVCAVFLVCKVILSNGQLPRAFNAAIDPARLGLLLIFLIYGFFTAYVMPRLFAHMVEVIPINATVPWAVLLEPTSGNFTQPAYMALSVGMVVAFAVVGESGTFRRHYLQATLCGGLVLIATGFVDMTMAAVGGGDLLEPFRNATYTLLVDVEISGGTKRVVGLMPEASSFGTLCVYAVASLVFLRPCFENAMLRSRLVPLTIFGLLGMAALSTSSTAYVGLAIFVPIYAANWLRRALSPNAPARDGLKWEASLALAAAMLILCITALVPSMLDSVYDVIDQTIFKKSQTGSFVERTMWTRIGMEAFFATSGLGVGLGSERTSNWFVGILSNTGIIGAVLLGWFILRLYFQRCRGDSETVEFVTALKMTLVPSFAMGSLAGTTPDIGVWMGSVLGLISALNSKHAASSFRSGVKAAGYIRGQSRS